MGQSAVLRSSLNFVSKYSSLLLLARDGGPVVLTAVGKPPRSISLSADSEVLYSLEPKFQHLNHKSTPQDPVLNEFNPICIFAGWFGAITALLSSQYLGRGLSQPLCIYTYIIYIV